MSRTRKAAAGFATSVAQYGVQITLQAALAPVLLHVAGQETLGAYAIVIQAIGYLALTDLGMSVSLSRWLARANGLRDGGVQFASLLRFGQRIVLLTNIAFASGLLALAAGIEEWFSLSASVGRDARVGMVILGVWTLVRTPFQMYANGLVAVQDLAARNIISTVSFLLRLAVSLFVVWLGWGLTGLMVAGVVSEASDLIACSLRYRLRGMPRQEISLPLEKTTVRELFAYGGNILVITLATRMIFYTGNLVSGYLFGAAAASVFYATQMPALVGWNLVHRIVDNATPAINELFGQAGILRLRTSFLRLHRFTLVLLIPLAVGIAIFNGPLVRAWVGPRLYVGDLASLCLAAFALVMSVAHVSNAFVMAQGRIHAVAWFALFEGLLNLLLSFVLGRALGLAGIPLAAFLANVPGSLYLQARAQRIVQISWTDYWSACCRPVAKASALPVLTLLIWRMLTDSPTTPAAICAGILYMIAQAVFSWKYVLASDERRQLEILFCRIRPLAWSVADGKAE